MIDLRLVSLGVLGLLSIRFECDLLANEYIAW